MMLFFSIIIKKSFSLNQYFQTNFSVSAITFVDWTEWNYPPKKMYHDRSLTNKKTLKEVTIQRVVKSKVIS